MYYITYNDVVTPGIFKTKEDAVREIEKIFSDIDFDNHDVAFWPSISARGNTKIQIRKQELE